MAATAASLEAQLQEAKKDRKIERFFWIFVLTVIFDVALTLGLPWYGTAFAWLMSLILLIGCAKWLEVPWVVTHLERMFDKFYGRQMNEAEPEN